jgi:endoglucanase
MENTFFRYHHRHVRIGHMLLCLWLGTGAARGESVWSDKMRVDQFGYLPDAVKVAVIADPVHGWNGDETYTPGGVLEVRRLDPGGEMPVVFSGAPVAWNSGAVHSQSGDRVWWFDFSAVTDTGRFHIHDPANDTHSDAFIIDPAVYDPVLRAAVRMFFYQRVGFAKLAPFAGTNWVDTASHEQDAHARPVWDQENAAWAKDLSGGWYDAGDYNKYTEWTARVVMELLLAYRQRPDVFTDDFGLPESGNGVPDLLDEVKWGLDWLLRMQEESGALLGKVSVLGHVSSSPPGTDLHPRYYGPVSTEATAAGAAAFALAATVYEEIGLPEYAASLTTAAIDAWQWTMANPEVPFDNSGFESASPARNPYETRMNRLMAAIMLFERTGDPDYRDYVDSHYDQAQPIQWWYFYAFEAELQKALVHYAGLTNATASVAATIRQRMETSLNGAEFLEAWQTEADAYRAYLKDGDYTWGSNRTKAQVGSLFMNLDLLGIDSARSGMRRTAAMGYLHYLHGVNPVAQVYLSNMYDVGATRSVNTMYHMWFTDGSDWDHALTSPKGGPAPGYLVGGPNRYYSGTVTAIGEQPYQKAYLDWNTSWPENSWEITEPAIYYQSAYIHLLAALMPVPPARPRLRISTVQTNAGMHVHFMRSPHTAYLVHYTDDLSHTNWYPLATVASTPENSETVIIDNDTPAPHRFYRVEIDHTP